MAAALAISGETGFNPERDSIVGPDGKEFMFEAPDPLPLPEKGLVDAKGNFIPPLEEGVEVEIIIDAESERIELLEPFERWDGEDFTDLPVLVKTRGKTTTDHISPGGKWLKYRGHISNISENMLEGAINAYTGEPGTGTNIITGEKGVRFFKLARFYRDKAGGFVIIGDENYGEGSSREHAAMTPRFMGAKAVVARTFARIHEANLKKQGILPFTFADPADYDRIDEYDRISIINLAGLTPGMPVKAVITGRDHSLKEMTLNHTLTEEQIEWFRAGSALNAMEEEV
jgi:aconitate hydratase